MKTYTPKYAYKISKLKSNLLKVAWGIIATGILYVGLSIGSLFYVDNRLEYYTNEYNNKVIVQTEDIEACPLTKEECLENKFSLEDLSKIRKGSYEKAIEAVSTPAENKSYILTSIIYKPKENYTPSFKKIHETREGDCDNATLAAAALLSDDGFKSYMLVFYGEGNNENTGHSVFLHKTKDGYYGINGINISDNKIGFKSIDEIVNYMDESNPDYNLSKFIIFDLEEFSPDFIDNDRNNYILDERNYIEGRNKIDHYLINKLEDIAENDMVGKSITFTFFFSLFGLAGLIPYTIINKK